MSACRRAWETLCVQIHLTSGHCPWSSWLDEAFVKSPEENPLWAWLPGPGHFRESFTAQQHGRSPPGPPRRPAPRFTVGLQLPLITAA